MDDGGEGDIARRGGIETRIQGHLKALDANPNDVASRMGLAQAHMQGEQWEEAVEHLDKVVTDEPKNPQAPPLLARCYLSMGHMEKADAMFQKALTHIDNVSDPSVWMQVGKMYDLIKNNKAAEDAYKQVIQLDPPAEMKAEALFSLAYIAQLNKRIDLANQHLQTVLDMGSALWPSAAFPLTHEDVWFEMAVVFRDGGKGSEEQDAFMKSERDPSSPDSWHAHGKLLMQIQQYRQAQKAFLQAIEMSDSPAPSLWYSLAILHGKTFSYKESCNAFQHFANLAHTEIEDQSETVATLRESIQETGTKNLALNEELGGLKERQAAVLEETSMLSAEKAKFDAQMAAAAAKFGRHEDSLAATQQKLDVCMKQMRMLNMDVERHTGAKKRTSEELKRCQIECGGLRKETRQQKSQITAAQSQLANFKREVAKLQKQLELASPGGSMDPVKLTAELKATSEKLHDTELKYNDEVERLRGYRDENSVIKEQLRDAETREAHKDMLLGKASSKIEKLTGTVRNLQTKSYEQLMAEKADLQRKTERAIEQSRRSREDIKKLSESVYQTQTQSEMAQETLLQEVSKLKELRAEQTRELKNLKEQNADLKEQLSTYRSAAEELRDAHGEVSQKHDEIELERTLLDNKLRKATDKLTKLEANEAASEARALLVVAIDTSLNRLQRVVAAAEREELLALTNSKDVPISGSKSQDWKIHSMTDSDRALFKMMMMDDVDGLRNLLKKFGMEHVDALNSRGKSLLTVAREKERKGCATWLESQGAKAIDIEYDRNNPGLVDGATQYEQLPPAPPSLADLLLEEIWGALAMPATTAAALYFIALLSVACACSRPQADKFVPPAVSDPQRIIALLRDMEIRFDDTVAKMEHILKLTKDTESGLRTELTAARAQIDELQKILSETKESAKVSTKQIVDVNRVKAQGLESEIEKRRFSEWQLRAQLQDMQKRCNEALGLQRVEMVEHAKHKMTEMVLDQLMEDTSRNPTLAGDLSTRRRANTVRARSADNDTLQSVVPTLRAAPAMSTAARALDSSHGPGELHNSSATYGNIHAVDPALVSQSPTNVDHNTSAVRDTGIDDIIAEIRDIRTKTEGNRYQQAYARPVSYLPAIL